MSYQTLEVDLENGRVSPRGSEALPDKARALLTIVETGDSSDIPSQDSLGDRLRHLRGIGRGEYTDLSTNKEHLADMGR